MGSATYRSPREASYGRLGRQGRRIAPGGLYRRTIATVGTAPQGSDEDRKQRVDRELLELLNELRVAVTGIQVLFAFLLTVPFAFGFPAVTTFQRDVYFATLVCTALATAFLIAPSAQHRLLFRQRDKEALLVRSNVLAIVGLAFVAVAIVGVVVLITNIVFGTAITTIVFGALVAGTLLILWYVQPLRRRAQADDRTPSGK